MIKSTKSRTRPFNQNSYKGLQSHAQEASPRLITRKKKKREEFNKVEQIFRTRA